MILRVLCLRLCRYLSDGDSDELKKCGISVCSNNTTVSVPPSCWLYTTSYVDVWYHTKPVTWYHLQTTLINNYASFLLLKTYFVTWTFTLLDYWTLCVVLLPCKVSHQLYSVQRKSLMSTSRTEISVRNLKYRNVSHNLTLHKLWYYFVTLMRLLLFGWYWFFYRGRMER